MPGQPGIDEHTNQRIHLVKEFTVPKNNTWTVKRIRALGVTTDLTTAADVLSISRSRAFELARDGEFPVPIVRIGARVIVPVAGLLRLLLIIPELPHPPTYDRALEPAAESRVHVTRHADSTPPTSTDTDHPTIQQDHDTFSEDDPP